MNKQNNTIWDFFVHKYRFTFLIVLILLIFGLFSIIRLPKESMPEVEIPYAVVVTVFPGANAADVEELVTQPIEDKIKSLDDVEELTSQSKNSLSFIFVQFDANADAQEKINDLKDKIDEVKSDLPDDAKDPTVKQISLDDEPILTFSISGPYSRSEIKNYADDIKNEIEIVSGISSVDVLGGQDEEIKVIIDKAKLDNYGLSLLGVVQAIGSANSDVPAGSIESSGMEYTVRFAGRLLNIDEVKTIPIANISNTAILLKDVANVYSDYSELQTLSRLSKNGEETKTAISLNLYKTSGGDTIRIIDSVLSKLDKIKSEYPDDLSFDFSKNAGQDIKNDLSNLFVNGIETVIIVVVLLFLFLGWREALLAGLSVPTTFLMSFIFLSVAGYTLNFLTLFCLILSLGILVDNAIVVAEGINVNLNKGMKVKEACMASVKEYQWVLVAGTLTTVFAFLPLLGVSGVIGKFMVSIPITISAVLISSLFVALALIPTFGALLFKDKKDINIEDSWQTPFEPEQKKQKQILENQKNWKEKMMDNINEKYDSLISSLLADQKKSKKLLRIVSIAFILSLALPIGGVLKVSMFPTGNEPKVYMNFQLPAGTPLEMTSQKITEIEDLLLADENVESFLTNIGSKTSGGSVLSSNSSGNSNYAGIVVNLKQKRNYGSLNFIEKYNEELKNIDGIEYELTQDMMGPPSSDPISISVQGQDLEILDEISLQIKQIVENIPGTRSVRFSNQDSPGEFVLEIDRVKAQMYGISTSQIASVLRSAIAGVDATVIRKDGQEINVLVKYDLDGINDGMSNKQIDLNNIESITIASSQGNIPIASFIKSNLDFSRSLIQHEDGNRIMEIVGDIEEGKTSQDIFNQAKKEIKNNIVLPEGYTIKYGGENEDMAESFQDIFRSMILGIILISILLVLQFNSFKQTLFILVTVPLALIGVLPGLVFMGQPLSFPGAIGIVALVGIVVKNAIILIEKINVNREKGFNLDDAIKDGGHSRLRPIILTTITTVLGMIPLAMSDPTWGPLGYAIVFGLSFSTVLTLVVLPVIYQKFSQK
ncbi:MAG: efflux RND transporter permease subunit [Patescibacteria group bacterium]